MIHLVYCCYVLNMHAGFYLSSKCQTIVIVPDNWNCGNWKTLKVKR